jgi:hypothetical protein
MNRIFFWIDHLIRFCSYIKKYSIISNWFIEITNLKFVWDYDNNDSLKYFYLKKYQNDIFFIF